MKNAARYISRPFLATGRWMREHWILTIILLLIVVGVGYFLYKRSQPTVEVLKFTEVKKGRLVKNLNVSGVIDAKQKAMLRYATGGKLTYLGAREGDFVKKSQTLARVDVRDQQKRLQQDLNLYFNERMDFEQGRENRTDLAPTNQAGRLSQKEQKDLENAVLTVEIQDIAIRNSVLSSPIEGILVTAPANSIGGNLSPTDSFEVIDPNSLVFKAAIDEADISLLKRGQLASIEFDAYPDKPITASVSAIAYRSSVSTKGTVFVVELPIVNDYQYAILDRYRLGMNGDVDITVDERNNTLFIPLDALIERDDKSFVRRKTGDNTAEDVEVQTGIETETEIEILSGLSEGDQVVIPE